MKLKRLTSLVLALCLCATLTPMLASADTVELPERSEIGLEAKVTGNEEDGYRVNFVAQLGVSDELAKMVAMRKEMDTVLKTLRFTCILKNELLRDMEVVSKADFTTSGVGADNWEFLSVTKGAPDEIHIIYKLREDLVDRWKDPTVTVDVVKNDLDDIMTLTSTKTTTKSQLDEAMSSEETMLVQAWVNITYPDGESNLVPIYHEEVVNAAYGSTKVQFKETGGGGGGGGSSTPVEPEDPGIADPDDTGVSTWLNTDEHILFMVGDDLGNFRPEDAVTRAEVAQMFFALLRKKTVDFTTIFTDVAPDAWYSDAVHTLAAMGMVSGIGEGKYDPQRPITRAEFCAIASQFAKKAQAGTDFDDVPKNHWSYIGISTAAAYGWVDGVGNNLFAPNRSIKRVEAATIVNHMLGRLGDKEKIDAGLGRQFPDVHKSHWGYYEIAEATTAHDHTFNKTRTEETWYLK